MTTRSDQARKGRRTISSNYTAVVRKDGKWWIGWIQEIPGVNSQGSSRPELLRNLKSALKEALEFNCRDLGIPDV